MILLSGLDRQTSQDPRQSRISHGSGYRAVFTTGAVAGGAVLVLLGAHAFVVRRRAVRRSLDARSVLLPGPAAKDAKTDPTTADAEF
ncbi:hypothetical protein ACIOKD_24965 [Streptomyces sp. NPDC087844]|uniref:hypothetical protein n=1 Tax=Streptomyces sp. NPDC087844 TaxID=3365805 RepID=UPI0037FD8822